jgi:hypothetical protein
MYVPKHLIIQEIVPRDLYDIKDKDQLFGLFDEQVLMGADWLRNRYGPMTCNNWHIGGDFNWSGFRTVGSPHYSPGSMHSVGKALDLKFSKISADEIRANLRNLEYVPHITRIEDGVSWLHIDTKPTNNNKLHFFKA